MSLKKPVNKETRGAVWNKPVPDLRMSFSPSSAILLFTFGGFCRNHLSKNSDELTVWVGLLCRAVVNTSLPPRV